MYSRGVLAVYSRGVQQYLQVLSTTIRYLSESHSYAVTSDSLRLSDSFRLLQNSLASPDTLQFQTSSESDTFQYFQNSFRVLQTDLTYSQTPFRLQYTQLPLREPQLQVTSDSFRIRTVTDFRQRYPSDFITTVSGYQNSFRLLQTASNSFTTVSGYFRHCQTSSQQFQVTKTVSDSSVRLQVFSDTQIPFRL